MEFAITAKGPQSIFTFLRIDGQMIDIGGKGSQAIGYNISWKL